MHDLLIASPTLAYPLRHRLYLLLYCFQIIILYDTLSPSAVPFAVRVGVPSVNPVTSHITVMSSLQRRDVKSSRAALRAAAETWRRGRSRPRRGCTRRGDEVQGWKSHVSGSQSCP